MKPRACGLCQGNFLLVGDEFLLDEIAAEGVGFGDGGMAR